MSRFWLIPEGPLTAWYIEWAFPRLETQAIDAYNDAHHYRAENPLTHLHEDEAPVETDKLKSFH